MSLRTIISGHCFFVCLLQMSNVVSVTAESCGHTRVAILFSGGIDSLVLAALADRFAVSYVMLIVNICVK